jgi:hypothetical protein
MGRTLILGPKCGLYGLRRFEPIDQRVDARTQGLDLAVLAKHNITQLGIRALEEGDFRFDLLKGVGLHHS